MAAFSDWEGLYGSAYISHSSIGVLGSNRPIARAGQLGLYPCKEARTVAPLNSESVPEFLDT
jgi:hypothetical protein